MAGKPILVVPDIHQDARFLRECLRIPAQTPVEEILFLGDLLDSKSREGRLPDTIRTVLREVRSVLERQDPPATLLWGNHDWKYWVFRDELAGHRDPAASDHEFFLVRDLSPLTADLLFEEGLGGPGPALDLWKDHAVLAAERRGWLITHAGVHPDLWPGGTDLADGVDRLNRTMEELRDECASLDGHPLLGAGPARGGFHEIGGPLWLDFNEEFVDDLPFPQIVGHTRCPDVLRSGRSYCLDACQQVCALLHPDGNLEFRVVT
jgi:hypothetical protein